MTNWRPVQRVPPLSPWTGWVAPYWNNHSLHSFTFGFSLNAGCDQLTCPAAALRFTAVYGFTQLNSTRCKQMFSVMSWLICCLYCIYTRQYKVFSCNFCITQSWYNSISADLYFFFLHTINEKLLLLGQCNKCLNSKYHVVRTSCILPLSVKSV